MPGCPCSKSSFLEAFLFFLVATTSSMNHLQAIKLCFSWLMLPGHRASPEQYGILSGAWLTAAHTFSLPCSRATWQLCKTHWPRHELIWQFCGEAIQKNKEKKITFRDGTQDLVHCGIWPSYYQSPARTTCVGTSWHMALRFLPSPSLHRAAFPMSATFGGCWHRSRNTRSFHNL